MTSIFHDSNPSRPLINSILEFSFEVAEILKSLKSSAVCIIQRSQAPWCASYCGVKHCGVHPTLESSDQKICNAFRLHFFEKLFKLTILQSLTPGCTLHRRVNNLPSVCFDPMFYKCYFSVMSYDINMKIKKCIKIFFSKK